MQYKLEGENLNEYSGMVRMYNLLENDTNDLGSIIHFDEKNLKTFGIRIYNLLFLSCNLFEYAAKEIVKEKSGITDTKMNTWKEDPFICYISENELTFIPMRFKLKPMEEFGFADVNDRNLKWWQDYNSVKHDLSEIHKATLQNLIYALGSAGLLVNYATNYVKPLRGMQSILFEGMPYGSSI